MTAPPRQQFEEHVPKRQLQFPDRTLAGKVVLLAGGSGGLGSVTAALLVREGARLVIGYRLNRQRAVALQKALEQLGGQVKMAPGDGGLHAVAHLPDGSDDAALQRQAADLGLVVPSLSRFHLSETRKAGFLLGFAAYSDAQVEDAMQRLATVPGAAP